MNCPTCGNSTAVTHTRPGDGSTRRRRCCGRCGFVAFTTESWESADVGEAARLRRELANVAGAATEALAEAESRRKATSILKRA